MTQLIPSASAALSLANYCNLRGALGGLVFQQLERFLQLEIFDCRFGRSRRCFFLLISLFGLRDLIVVVASQIVRIDSVTEFRSFDFDRR